MKIAVLDFGMSLTHRRLNLINYQVLSEIAELYLINSGSYYDSLSEQKGIHLCNVNIVEHREKKCKKQKNSITGRIEILYNMRENKRLFKQYKDVKFDCVLIMGYEILTFALYRTVIPSGIPVYIYQHQQIDELKNRIKSSFFSMYKNKVSHIVMEDFFAEYMKNEINAKYVNIVHFINRPIVIPKHTKNKPEEKMFILGISSTNDEEMVLRIIEHEKKYKFLPKYNVIMRLRSKKYSFCDDFLTVSNDFLSDTEYDQLYQKAGAILSLLPEHFNNRLSGPVLDAIADGKIVIGTKRPLVQMYQQMAPSMFKLFENMEELEIILDKRKWNIEETELRALQCRHQPETVKEEYKKCFGI